MGGLTGKHSMTAAGLRRMSTSLWTVRISLGTSMIAIPKCHAANGACRFQGTYLQLGPTWKFLTLTYFPNGCIYLPTSLHDQRLGSGGPLAPRGIHKRIEPSMATQRLFFVGGKTMQTCDHGSMYITRAGICYHNRANNTIVT